MYEGWMVAAALVTALDGSEIPLRPHSDALVTVFTYNRTGVPWDVLARARRVATAAFAEVGIEVRWVEGKKLGESQKGYEEVLTVVLEGPAPACVSPGAMALTTLAGGGDGDVRIFYDRVASFLKGRAYMPEVLGNVLAHELTHVLQGVARHSDQGLMKAGWSDLDYSGMALRRPLPFAAIDVDLLRTHFKTRKSTAVKRVPAP